MNLLISLNGLMIIQTSWCIVLSVFKLNQTGAKLTVREGQMAVMVNEGQMGKGQVADVFMLGMYELSTANMPILSTLKGWKYGFSSPFKAEIYFFKTTRFTDLKWGTGWSCNDA